MHSQLMVGACCVCICFICLLKVNNLQVCFCFFGACVSVLPCDLRVLLDVLCCLINHSFHYKSSLFNSNKMNGIRATYQQRSAEE